MRRYTEFWQIDSEGAQLFVRVREDVADLIGGLHHYEHHDTEDAITGHLALTASGRYGAIHLAFPVTGEILDLSTDGFVIFPTTDEFSRLSEEAPALL